MPCDIAPSVSATRCHLPRRGRQGETDSHARNGLLEKDALRSAIPWGAAAAIAGALVAAAVDTDLLRRPFGIYLLLAAGITLRQLWRDRKG